MTGTVDADPYPWPYDGTIDPARTALVNIDWQVDFCGQGGYVDAMGYDLNLTRSGLEPTTKVLAAARAGPRGSQCCGRSWRTPPPGRPAEARAVGGIVDAAAADRRRRTALRRLAPRAGRGEVAPVAGRGARAVRARPDDRHQRAGRVGMTVEDYGKARAQ